MEVLPDEVYKKHDFKSIRINYKSAVKTGEEICVKYTAENLCHKVFIFGLDGNLKTSIEIYEKDGTN